ncbi:hypothetical protein JCM24511_04538 [Saitozyma sp. JCM 24511]|nr:hypothetical protein JCM24511_04538 [Saitozyma sp. JCM 24511]
MVRSSDVLLILLGIIFPPAAAAVITGCSCELLITICLTILGYIPGHCYVFYLIYKKMKAEEEYGFGNVRYLGNGEYQPIGAPINPPPPQQPYYGATR